MGKDLENYMKNRPKARLLRIESMGNELVSLNIMAESVGSEVKSLADRWAILEEKVCSIFVKFVLRLTDSPNEESFY